MLVSFVTKPVKNYMHWLEFLKAIFSKCGVLVNSFITSQFSYYSLIWMFHSRRMEHRVNKIDERVLRLIYPSDSKLTFEELLDRKKTVSIHQKNLHVLATEIFKAKLNISPKILKDFFLF